MTNENTEVGFRGRKQNHKWWNRRSRTEKIIGIACLLLLILCISLLVVSIITQNKLKKAKEEASSICKSKECIRAASDLLENIDSSIEPCENFYDFACGNFIKKNVVPDDHLKTSIVGNMQNDIYIELKKLVEPPVTPEDTEVTIKTKNLYASCMNSSVEDGSVEILQQLLERVGRWPIVDTKWKEQDSDTERILAILFVHGVTPFIQADVEDDDQNITDYVFEIRAGTLILPDKFYLNASNEQYQEGIQAYKKMVIGTARILEAPEPIIQQDVEDMIKFEKDYATISQADTQFWQDRYDSNDTEEFNAKRYTVIQLEEAIPELKWGHFLDKIFDYFRLQVRKDNLTITVWNEKYFRNLTILLKQTSPRTLANYLTWRFVYNMMPYLDVHFRRLYYDFKKAVPENFDGDQMYSSRWRQCISIVKSAFRMPLTSLYVKDNFNNAKKDEINELIKSIKQAYIGNINQQDWLDEESKTVCVEKINEIKTKMGFPRYVLKPDELTKQYSGLKIVKDRFLDNMLTIHRYNVAEEMSKLTGKTEQEPELIDDPLSVNAYYIPFTNTIVFPLAMLRSPVFVPGRPKYINYARLGVIIGHEISHGFDTFGFRIGMLYKEPSSGPEPWFKEEIGEQFIQKAMCFSEQYSKLPIPIIEENVDGNHTINDNICDNVGLRNVYRAYNEYIAENGEEPRLPGVSYTNSQVFFIKYAQVWCEELTKAGSEMYTRDQHSPGRHRSNVPLANSPEFSEAFNCPLGSPMNPEEKCNLFA